MQCGRTLEFVGFDRLVLVRREARGPEFDVCGVRLPRRYSRVGVPCFRVLVSRVHNMDVATDVLGSRFVFWFRESVMWTWQPTCWVLGSGFVFWFGSLGRLTPGRC